MSELSWIIYLGGVSEALWIVAFLGAVITLMACLLAPIAFVTGLASEKEDHLKWLRASALAFLVSALFVVALPSRETVFAIAAVEFGSDYVASPDGQRVTGKAAQALEAWLDRQVEGGEQ